ncbi:MAG: YfhO family protein [Candidatus Gottesmanbacteria bacterium]|nr:YfhO family protein [Candidatus Gottesmanbacteria bacterium]
MKHFLVRSWPIGVIILVWFIFSSPYFLRNLVPFPSSYLVTFFPPWNTEYGMPVKNNAMPDVISQIYPWKKITIDSWREGQIPLWNPYSFSGTPHAGNYQTAVFSPINLLYGILPFMDAWSMSILLQPLLAGFFMYYFLRCLKRSQEASTLGSIAFMFCGFLTVWMAYGTLGWAILWLPLLMALVSMHVNNRTWWNLVFISFFVAWSFFSGHFQISMYVLIAVSSYIMYQTYQVKHGRAGVELGMAVVIGLMASSPQILLSLEAYSHSVRSELFAQTGGIAWNYLVTLFSPDFFGNPVTRNDWFGYYAEWASYIGVIPFLLVIYAIVRRTRGIAFFLGLAIITLFMATPSPLNNLVLLLKIPAISTSYAARVIVLTSFSLVVIAAFGLDRLREDWESNKKNISSPFLLGIGICLILIWGILLIYRPFPVDKLLIAKRNVIFSTVLSASFCLFVIVGYIKRWKFMRRMLIGLCIGITAMDMLRYAIKWMPFERREYVYPDVDILLFIKKNIGYDRFFGNVGGEVTNGFSLAGIEGYDAVYQKRYGEFIRFAYDGTLTTPERSVVQFPKNGKFAEQVLRLLGTRLLAHRLSDGRQSWTYPYWNYPNYQSIYRNKHYQVYENAEVLPRAFLASSYRIAVNDQSILDTLYSDHFNPRDTVVLEREPVLIPQSGEGSVDIAKYTPNEIVLQSKSAVPKLLFLSDVYDNGWQATVDGEDARIDRADYDFRVVGVPPGEHTIRMVYWPKSFVYGLWIAVIGGVSMMIMIYRIKKV